MVRGMTYEQTLTDVLVRAVPECHGTTDTGSV